MNPEFGSGEFENLKIRVKFLKKNLEQELLAYEEDKSLPPYNYGLYKDISTQLDNYSKKLTKGNEIDVNDLASSADMVQIFLDDLRRKKAQKLLSEKPITESIN